MASTTAWRQEVEGASWESGHVLTALMTVDTDNLAQRNGQRIVPVDTVPARNNRVTRLNHDSTRF